MTIDAVQDSVALARLLAHENTVSDLLMLLIELDGQPFVEFLELGPGPIRATREAVVGGGRGDVMISRVADGCPLALLEMKVASDVHGDQLENYERWAAEHAEPSLWLCTLDGDRVEVGSWMHLSLVRLFGAWSSSVHDHARWLAEGIGGALAMWDREADGPVGLSSGRPVADIFTRRVVAALRSSSGPSDISAAAWRTGGGNPMFMAWVPHPDVDAGARLGVDVRCPGRGSPGQPWLFRPCVEVRVVPGRAPRDARLLAHDLVVRIAHRMTGTAVQRAFRAAGLETLAEALTATHRNGFRRALDDVTFAESRARIVDDEIDQDRTFFFDALRLERGVRLASQFRLDLTNLDRPQVEALCRATLAHLLDSASGDLGDVAAAP